MQKNSTLQNYSLPFSPSSLFSLYTPSFLCSVQESGDLQPAFEWLSIHARIKHRWAELQVIKVQSEENGFILHLTCQKNPGITAQCTLHVSDGLLTASLDSQSKMIEALAIDFTAQPNEHFLGFGERFNRIDQRGQEIDLYVTNGASGGLAYKPVPFYMSSAGYGIHLQTSVRTKVCLACYDEPGVVSIRTESNKLAFQLWTGEPFVELLQRYAQLIGLPLYQPPAWIFGPWKSRDWTSDDQKLSLEDMRLPRSLKLANTVKLIDAAWESDLNDFLFNDKYPDPVTMLTEARNLGYVVVIWVSPWMVKRNPDTAIYAFCAQNGFLIKDKNGDPYVHRLGNSPGFMGTCFDFTNPEAVAWWQEQIERLVQMGVDGFKTDFGEQVPDDAVFYDGRSGHELHNLFPLLYNQATYQAMQKHTRGVLLARSAWHGSQRYCAIWAGDQSSDFGPATGLSSVILAGQNAGLSGFSCWASDIGGYFGQPTEETFNRWIAFGAFSPIMQLHGLGCREPWDFSVKTLETYKFYSHIHLNLFPYIYTYAQIASQTGLPLMRAMSFAYPKDPVIWNPMLEYEYMFGAELLVAPVYFGHTNNRQVYLPAGNWCDFWSGEALQGGRDHIVKVGMGEIPVFAKAGAIIPLLDGNPDTLLACDNPNVKVANQDLRLQVYNGANGDFKLYDGSIFSWQDQDQSLIIQDVPTPRWISIKKMGSNRLYSLATGPDGQTISLLQGDLTGNPDFIRLWVETPGQYKVIM